MASGVLLYKQQLFTNCIRSTVVKRFNNAPGLPGGGGIDADAAGRIGYKNIDTGVRVAGSNKGRVQGICCGITAAWMVALLGGNEAATDHDEFTGYFMGPLRFQGAYVKDFKGNAHSLGPLLAGFGLRNSNQHTSSVTMGLQNIETALPGEDGPWAGYISAYGHAVGIGWRNYRFFLMEPNAGLFEWRNKARFAADLKGFLVARHAGGGGAAGMKAYFFRA